MSQYLIDPGSLDPKNNTATLEGEEAHHLLRVARTRVGEKVRLFDGVGNVWTGVLAQADHSRPLVAELASAPSNEPPCPVHLIAGLIKGDRWEWLLEKAVELGATRITPLNTSRTVAKPSEGNARLERWGKIIASAAKQCERGRIPHLDHPVALNQFLRGLPQPEPTEKRRLLAERSGAPLLEPWAGPVRLAVGPEGGFSAEEAAAFTTAGFAPVWLGGRILRAETAGLAALAICTSGS